jgi:hypothetical protein
LQNLPNAYPDNQHLRNVSTVPPDYSAGTATFTASNTTSAGTITVGDILIQSSSSSSVNVFRSGNQIILSATAGIETGNILVARSLLPFLQLQEILKQAILVQSASLATMGSFSLPCRNIELSTIVTGTAESTSQQVVLSEHSAPKQVSLLVQAVLYQQS